MRTHSLRNLLSAVVAFSLFLIPVYGYSASALWIAESKGVIKVATADGAILFEIPDAKGIDSVAIDNENSRVWTYGEQRLKAYSSNGILQINETHPTLPHMDKPVDMLADCEGVWLAIDEQLFRFDEQGKLKKELNFKQPIHSLTLDSMRNRLWLAVPGTVFILDSKGRDLKQFRPPHPGISQLEYDVSLDQTWVVVAPYVLRLDARTQHLEFVSESGLGHKLRDHVSADGRGGLWGAANKQVNHLHANGTIDLSFSPFSGFNAQLQDLAADSDDGSVWLANRTTLKQYNLAGAQQKEFVPDLGDGIIRSINRMALSDPGSEAPVLTIASPTNGSFINSNRPNLELEYTSSGTIDTESIEIKHNDTLLNADCTADQTKAECFINTVLDEGEITLGVTIANEDGTRSEPDTVTFTVDTLAPVIFISVPQDGLITNNPALTLEGNVDEPLDSMTLSHNGSLSTLTLNNNNFSRSLNLSEGTNTLTVNAADLAGNLDSQTVTIVLDTIVPAIPDIQQITVGNSINGVVSITGANNSVEANSRVTITNIRTGERITVTADANGAFTADIAALPNDVLAITVTDAANNHSESLSTSVSNLPPDPSAVAPPLNPTQITPMLDAVSFLYTGRSPIQTGVEPGTIEARRVAVIRGKVLDKQNNPLPGVTVTVKDHSEFGQTLSRADGMFDLAVNGGGILTLNYRKEEYLPVQRQVNAPWQDYIFADDIVMIQLDPQVSVIDLNSTQAIQVAQGSPQTDSDGTRQATLLFPAGTTATMTLPDGSQQQLSTLSVRATEYTVGDNGPEAMPAPLPPTSGYTYAVELSVDEAIANGIKRNGVDVSFNQPVPFYVDNFLNFPTGETVPVGYYDGDRAAWIPYESGRIVKILNIENGIAVLDITGAGTPAKSEELLALGITDAERSSLAELYVPGKSLWRVALRHFSTWDHNWPYRWPDDATPPNVPTQVADKNKPNKPCTRTGCTISAQSQSLGEEIPITGTPYSLHYQSDRMPGRKGKNTIVIPFSGATFPGSLRDISVSITVAGQRLTRTFNPQTGLQDTFEWNGLDGFGRPVYGEATAHVFVTYIYPCIYVRGTRFGRPNTSSVPQAIGTRDKCYGFAFHRDWKVILDSPLMPPVAVAGGWSLDVHHTWSIGQSRLYMGNGGYRTLPPTIHTVAGNGTGTYAGDGSEATKTGLLGPRNIVIDAAGNILLSESSFIRRISPEGIITTIAGNGNCCFSGDGGPAINAALGSPGPLALDAAGNLYIGDTNTRRIRKVDVNGIITTIAGTGGSLGFSGDGGPATDAVFWSIDGVAADAVGNIYVTDGGNERIRRIGPDGIIETIAGTGVRGFSGDGGPATQARINLARDLAVDEAGNLYIADNGNMRVRKISPDGIITTVAGNGQQGFSGDGSPAIQARITSPQSVTLDRFGNLFIAEGGNARRIRRVGVDGIITTVAGAGPNGFSGDGGPATLARLANTSTNITVDSGGDLYIVDSGNRRVRKVSSLGSDNGGLIKRTSEDGIHQYVFDAGGRHLRTVNTLTGETENEFGRDVNGRLISIADADGDITTIERNGTGDATAIVAPEGQRTVLAMDSNGYMAAVTNPANEIYKMTYTSDGLLTFFRDRRNQLNSFEYDPLGRLVQDTNAGNGGWTLRRSELGNGYQTTMTTAEGRVERYTVQPQSNGDRLQINTLADGSIQQLLFKTNGQEITTLTDGTVITLQEGPDPRFGMQAPVPESSIVRMPSGLTSTTTVSRAAVLSNLSDPLSLQSLIEITTINGRAFRTDYNGLTRTFTETSAVGRTTTQVINEDGYPVSLQITGLAPVNFSYDPRGRLESVLQSDGARQRLTQMNYFASGAHAGFLQSVTDAEDHIVTFEYDNVGRVTKQTLPDNRIIQYGYDANDNITSIMPPGRPAHVFRYDTFDLEEQYTPPSLPEVIQSATIYDYNRDKELVKITRPDEQEINFAYNTGAQLTSMTLPGGIYSYTYIPGSGQLDTITSPDNITLDYSYNGFLLTGQAWSGAIAGSVTQGYDNNFRMTSQSVNGANTVAFQYDNDSLLTHAGSLIIFRDPQKGGLITDTIQGGVQTTQSYSAFGELSTIDADANSADIYDVSYIRDNLGRITQKTEVVEGQATTEIYGYDSSGRLETVERNGALTTYRYDSNGNRLSKALGSIVESGIYDAQDRLLSYGDCSYQYTPNGELTQKICGNEKTSYTYDVLGNLKQIVISGADQEPSTVIEYLTDGENRQVGKKVNGVLVQGFLYQDQLEPVAELDGKGNIVSRFIYGTKVNVPDFMIKGGITYRVISDHMSNPRLVINVSDGTVVQRIDYDEFGNVVIDTNPGFQPFGFAGGIYDQHTKLIRFGARDYEARTGRWTIKDPIRFDGEDANLYIYALSDPLSYFDSTGLAPAEHKNNKRESNRQKHEDGQARKQRDRGNEKGDKNRNPPRKRPPNHKGPWPRPRTPGAGPLMIWDMLQEMCNQGIYSGIGCIPKNEFQCET